MFLLLLFLCCIKVERPFHQTSAPVICNHDPQTWGSVGDIRANEPLFYFDIDCLFVCFVALRPMSTAMVIAGRSVHLTTLFPGQA